MPSLLHLSSPGTEVYLMRNIEIKNCEEELYEKAWDMRIKINAKSWADFLARAMEFYEESRIV